MSAGQLLRCACSHVAGQHSDYSRHCLLTTCACRAWRPRAERCPFCAGTGLDRDEEGAPCPACTGPAPAPQPDGDRDADTCACCVGLGWCCGEPDWHLICTACAGTGTAPTPRRTA